MSKIDPDAKRSLLACLRARALECRGRTALVFLADGEREGARLDYGELDARARAL